MNYYKYLIVILFFLSCKNNNQSDLRVEEALGIKLDLIFHKQNDEKWSNFNGDGYSLTTFEVTKSDLVKLLKCGKLTKVKRKDFEGLLIYDYIKGSSIYFFEIKRKDEIINIFLDNVNHKLLYLNILL